MGNEDKVKELKAEIKKLQKEIDELQSHTLNFGLASFEKITFPYPDGHEEERMSVRIKTYKEGYSFERKQRILWGESKDFILKKLDMQIESLEGLRKQIAEKM
jgi:hypothetical protein